MLIPISDLVFHPALSRVGLVPRLIARETALGKAQGKSRADHQAAAASLTAEFTATLEDISRRGIIDPLKVTPNPKGGWCIVDGRHRYEAALQLATQQFADPAQEAIARAFETAGVPCVEIPESQVSATILSSVNRRHYSKGALAYLAVLICPEVATEATKRKKAGLPSAAAAEGLAARAGVSPRLIDYAIRLYRTFAAREDARLRYEPGIWVGNSLERVLGGVESFLKGHDPEEAPESEAARDQRLATERAGKTVDRLDQLCTAFGYWEDMLPEGQTMIIERVGLFVTESPPEIRAAIAATLTALQA